MRKRRLGNDVGSITGASGGGCRSSIRLPSVNRGACDTLAVKSVPSLRTAGQSPQGNLHGRKYVCWPFTTREYCYLNNRYKACINGTLTCPAIMSWFVTTSCWPLCEFMQKEQLYSLGLQEEHKVATWRETLLAVVAMMTTKSRGSLPSCPSRYRLPSPVTRRSTSWCYASCETAPCYRKDVNTIIGAAAYWVRQLKLRQPS